MIVSKKRRLVRSLIAPGIGLLVAVGIFVIQPAPRAAASACTPARLLALVDDRIADLGNDGYVWRVSEVTEPGAAALTDFDAHTVTLDPIKVPCRLVKTIVNHEWMHTRQGQVLGAGVYLAYPGAELERVADCGSWLLGSTSMPYLTAPQRSCTADELTEARGLIQSAPAVTR